MTEKQQPKQLKTAGIRKNIALSTFYQILCIVTPLITAPYVSRVIGGKGIGIYSYTTSIQMYFSLFAALGTASYGNRTIARNRHDPYKRTILFWEIELLTVLTSTVMLAAWGVFLLFAPTYRIYFCVLTISLLNTMMDISWFYSGLEQFTYTVRQNTIFKLAGVILLFVLIKDENDLLLYILLMTGSHLLGTMSMWMYLPRFLIRIDRKELRVLRHLKETLVYFIPTIATSVYSVLDKTLIQWITHDPYQNGYYEQATKIINMVKSVTFTALNAVLSSRIAFLFKEKKYDEIRKRIDDSINYILFVGIGACFGLIGVADRFVPVFFGPGYEEVIPILQLLSPVVVIIGISNCLGSHYFTPAGLRSKSAKFIICGSVVNLCMNLMLIPRFKSIGAVIGTLAAESVITVLYLIFCDGYLTCRQLFERGWKKLTAGFLMLLAIRFVTTHITGNVQALLAGILCGTLYLLILLLLKDSFLFDIVRKQFRKKAGHSS
ncbi:MAG: flippase [Lachnospiraceae bacterium]|nr:flippase [Lachnospiraceae bacterium]